MDQMSNVLDIIKTQINMNNVLDIIKHTGVPRTPKYSPRRGTGRLLKQNTTTRLNIASSALYKFWRDYSSNRFRVPKTRRGWASTAGPPPLQGTLSALV